MPVFKLVGDKANCKECVLVKLENLKKSIRIKDHSQPKLLPGTRKYYIDVYT